MTTCNLTTNTEIKETSTPQTGTSRTYRGNRNTWSVSCEGLCSFDENHPHVKLRQLQQTFTVIPISWTATDDNGITENFSGNVIITQLSNDASASDFYTYQLQAQGTGDYTITDIPIDPNECCQDAWVYYTGTGSEGFSITLNTLMGRQIAGRLYRDGIEYRPSGVEYDGTGTPVGKQFKFDITTGKITFDSNLQPIAVGEPIDIPYNLCVSLASCEIVVNNVVPEVVASAQSTLAIGTQGNLSPSIYGFTLKGTPAAGDVVTVNWNDDHVDEAQDYSVTSTVQAGWSLIDLLTDVFNKIHTINVNSLTYTDGDGNNGVKIAGATTASGTTTITLANSSHFQITFLPTIDNVPTAPDNVRVRYSTDNGTTWTVANDITYDPDTNYELVVINDDIDTTGNYLFEVTPICSNVYGTPGTGYIVCIAVTIPAFSLPDAVVGELYDVLIPLSGTGPFTLSDKVNPAWITTFEVVGNDVHISGTPASGDVGSDITISFTVHNCTNKTADYSDTINVAISDTKWVGATFISGDSLTDYEQNRIQGTPGATVTITVGNYINTNGGSLTIDGTDVTAIGQTFDFVLDSMGYSGEIDFHIDGVSNSASIILGRFDITSTTSGAIGSPSSYQISKVF